jgi:uncharacterized Tic20 family protein
MVAHLAGAFNLMFPFSGLIGAILVYSLHRHDSPIVRDNARNAINMQLTLTIFNIVVFAIAMSIFVSLFFSMGQYRHGAGGTAPPPQFIWYFLCFLTLFAVNVIFAVVVCFAARAAYLGRIFRYPIAFPFLRSPQPFV